jgi:hypothetical protein
MYDRCFRHSQKFVESRNIEDILLRVTDTTVVSNFAVIRGSPAPRPLAAGRETPV